MGRHENYFKGALKIKEGDIINRHDLLSKLGEARYSRNDLELKRGTFRARGDVIELMPAYENIITRISLWGDEIEKITKIDAVSGEVLEICDETIVFPAVHYISSANDKEETLTMIR